MHATRHSPDLGIGLAGLLLLAIAVPSLAQGGRGCSLVVETVGPGTGTVTSVPAGISCSTSCSATFPMGTTVRLTATPDPGFELASWSGGCSGPEPCKLVMNGPNRVVAAFKPVGDPFAVHRHFLTWSYDGAEPMFGAPVSDGTYLYGMTATGGRSDLGVIYRVRPDGSGYTLLHDFLGGAGDGANPYDSLILDAGVLYGMTSAGGASNRGTAFRIGTDGSGFQLIHSFAGVPDGAEPHGSLTLVEDALYGMTYLGGAYDNGTVFRLDPSGTVYEILHHFDYDVDNGSNPHGSLTEVNGLLYGLTEWGGNYYYGTIFTIDPGTADFALQYSFSMSAVDSAWPTGSLALANGVLYGMTTYLGAHDRGLIFAFDPETLTFTVVHPFEGGPTDGSNPWASLISVAGTLYGTTYGGGTNGLGTVFKYDPLTDLCTVVHSFSESTQGSYPRGTLAFVGGALVGTTRHGGASGLGTVFSLGTDGAPLKVLHSFERGFRDGAYPPGSLTLDGATLYGMTSWGGAGGYGIVFSINVDGSHFQTLQTFGGGTADGGSPRGSLTLHGEALYGMTCYGGANSNGTIFKVNKDGTGFSLLHSFQSGDAENGTYPVGSLSLVGETLYGMTPNGGAYGKGTLFKLDTLGTGFVVLHSFGGEGDGARPYGSLTLHGGMLFGTTAEGGAHGLGTIFKMDPGGATYERIRSFVGGAGDGRAPYGSLTAVGDALYGMTCHGGQIDRGTLFRVNPDGGGFALLHSFGDDRETCPTGSLTLDGEVLYGMSPGEVDSGGLLFRVDPDGSDYIVLRSFTGKPEDGAAPEGDLTLGDKVLYGMTSYGGLSDLGTIFSLRYIVISGTVTFRGAGLAGVTMTGLPGNPVTDSSGRFSARVPFPWSSYVAPHLSAHSFEPDFRPVGETRVDWGGVDFAAFSYPEITSGNTAIFIAGVPGSFLLTASGYVPPEFSVAGSLPGGLGLENLGGGKAMLCGTPVVGSQGKYQVTLTAANNTPVTDTQLLTLIVLAPAHTTTTVASSKNPAPVGYPVRFGARVSFYTRGLGVPTGTIQFAVDDTPRGEPVPLESAQAWIEVANLARGTHTVTATYSGDGRFVGSTGTLTGGQEIGP